MNYKWQNTIMFFQITKNVCFKNTSIFAYYSNRKTENLREEADGES